MVCAKEGNWEKVIEDYTPAQAQSSGLNEELGQVEFIFSDKTGTLTQNVMELKNFTAGGNTKKVSNVTKNPRSHFVDEHSAHYQFGLMMILCHSIVIDKGGRYNSDSPDELAIVEAIGKMGFKFGKDNNDIVTIMDYKGLTR